MSSAFNSEEFHSTGIIELKSGYYEITTTARGQQCPKLALLCSQVGQTAYLVWAIVNSFLRGKNISRDDEAPQYEWILSIKGEDAAEMFTYVEEIPNGPKSTLKNTIVDLFEL
ncbi:hypothetical protein TWF106_006430 [Orbilia oligospora]|uniref:Uncharacterized protein n=1 Tax=Orbilia oligospora TaxID=2813651 RepID=A0A7C8QRX9_ORBOL|nr:hypothetical protein TWF106_006430 [Orbilia oligospora]